MQKGFGLYSPHETTVLFLKATLVSIWIGLDLVVLLTVCGLPQGALDRHLFLLIVVVTILAVGTVFSILFAWATGALFARTTAEDRRGVAGLEFQALMHKPRYLIGAGLVGVAIVMCIAAILLFGHAFSHHDDKQMGRADPVVAQKCTEVASMEQTLFRSDERVVMTQCMLQYDKTYAALHSN